MKARFFAISVLLLTLLWSRDVSSIAQENFAVYAHVGPSPRNRGASSGGLWSALSRLYFPVIQEPFPAYTAIVSSTGVIELVNHWDQATNDVFVQGNYAYVGQGTRLGILDVSNPISPTLIGQTDLLTYTVQDIYVLDDCAYVAARSGGLRVVDVSMPSNPDETGFYKPSADVYLVEAMDGYAYIAWEDGELGIVDISDPSNPAPVGSRWIDFGIADMKVDGDYVYLSTTCSSNKIGALRVVNVSTPTNPIVVSYTSMQRPQGVDVAGDYVYVAFSEPYMILPGDEWLGGLKVMNVSDPANPVETGFYGRHWAAYDIAVMSDSAYVVGDYGLRLFDVSDPTNPVVASFYNRQWNSRADDYRLAVAGDYIYIAAREEGLFVLHYSKEGSSIDVTISGPTQVTALQADYRFTALISPGTASLPITYTWAPEPSIGQGEAVVTYTWTLTDVEWFSPISTVTLSVMATNVQGTAIDTHTVTIGAENLHKVYLPVVLK